MDGLNELLSLFLHLDQHLADFTARHGAWVYGLLFLIVFAETGLVVTPFLPGDSLLFVTGALGGAGVLSTPLAAGLIFAAAVTGDAVNYAIGRWLGPRVFSHRESRWLNPRHLEQTHAFYERHGGKTIVIARFVPIVRTYAPFVAGVGAMGYRQFAAYNVLGAALWVLLVLGAGHFFGGLPLVKDNLKWVILGIIVLSLLPVAWEWWRARRAPA